MSALSDVSYRAATLEDALCASVLGMQVFLDTYCKEGIRSSVAREALDHFSVDAFSELLSSPSTEILVAERDGHLVAFAQLTLGSQNELVPWEPAVELRRLYVQEPFTAKGIGQALLRRAEELAASHGARALWLTAWVGNPRALAFYARQGYKELGADVYVYENEEYETRVFVKEV
jgi:GNAT superfamily N-acetyltransferase